jgi:hypothetical protein
MNFTFYDLIGSIGVAVIIITYIFLQLGKIESKNPLYSILNAVGASLIIFSLYFDFNFSAFVVEFFWLLISLFGIGRYLLNKKN